MRLTQTLKFATISAVICTLGAATAAAQQYEYKVLATKKTSTMEKEMNEAAEAGYIFQAVMGGDTAAGGDEAVVVMARVGGAPATEKRVYKLLATNKTSTMQKEMTEAGNEGFEYRGQTVFNTTFGGREVVSILEYRPDLGPQRYEYLLLATNKTSTMEKELLEAGATGFELVGLTVAKTTFGGSELVSILQKKAE